MDLWGEGGEEQGQLPFMAGDVISEDDSIILLAGLAMGHNAFQVCVPNAFSYAFSYVFSYVCRHGPQRFLGRI